MTREIAGIVIGLQVHREQFGSVTGLKIGAVAELVKAAVLKTAVPKGTGGSNPSRSVKFAVKVFMVAH